MFVLLSVRVVECTGMSACMYGCVVVYTGMCVCVCVVLRSKHHYGGSSSGAAFTGGLCEATETDLSL